MTPHLATIKAVIDFEMIPKYQRSLPENVQVSTFTKWGETRLIGLALRAGEKSGYGLIDLSLLGADETAERTANVIVAATDAAFEQALEELGEGEWREAAGLWLESTLTTAREQAKK